MRPHPYTRFATATCPNTDIDPGGTTGGKTSYASINPNLLVHAQSENLGYGTSTTWPIRNTPDFALPQ